MIRRFGFTGAVVVVLFIGVTNRIAAQSQQPRVVTVSQAVQEAVEKNLNLLAERYNVSIADAQLVTARVRPNPLLIINAGNLDLLGTGFDETNFAGPPEYAIGIDWIISEAASASAALKSRKTPAKWPGGGCSTRRA